MCPSRPRVIEKHLFSRNVPQCIRDSTSFLGIHGFWNHLLHKNWTWEHIKEKRPAVLFTRHFWAAKLCTRISARMKSEATKSSCNINTTVPYVMWRETCLVNVGLLQRVKLLILLFGTSPSLVELQTAAVGKMFTENCSESIHQGTEDFNEICKT
jgi:hypothetical protein